MHKIWTAFVEKLNLFKVGSDSTLISLAEYILYDVVFMTWLILNRVAIPLGQLQLEDVYEYRPIQKPGNKNCW